MKTIELTAEWLSNWRPTKTTEVTDRGRPGLVVRAGVRGIRVYYRWADERDPKTGKARRKRVRLGTWPALPLGEARDLVAQARERKQTEVAGSDLTIGQLAEAYRRDILSQREPASLAWSWGIIRTHVLPATPDKKRPPFGEWPARTVRPPDVAAVVRAAREERIVKVAGKAGAKVERWLGGPGAARATLREVKAIFAAAVGAGSLEMSPAAVLQAKALGLKPSKRSRYLSSEEIKALFEAIDLNAILNGTAKKRKLTEPVRLGIALLLYVPVRTHSLIGARWDELDLKAGRWVIPVARQKLHGDDRAEARPFTVPLPATAAAILERLKNLAGESPFVLANKGGHLGAKVLVRALERLQSSGRLSFGSKITVHDLRRTWRSWAADLGIAFEVAEKSLSHVLPGVADTYARGEMLDQRQAAADLVGAAFDRILRGQAAAVVPIRVAKAQ